MARFNLHLKLWAEQVSTSWEHNDLRAWNYFDLPLAHLEGALENTLAEGYVIGLKQGVKCRHITATHEGFPVFKSACV